MSEANDPDKVVTSLRELQQDIAPERDLWASIERSIKEDVAQRSRTSRQRYRWLVPFGVAAATSFLAIGLWIGRTSVDVAPMVADRPADASVLPAVLEVDADYAALRARLEERAIAGLANLSDEERNKVAASLTTIQQAVKELESALGKDPSNALLQVLLVQSCQEEMRVLATLERAADPAKEISL
jgi:hypothetical protein